MGLSSAPNSPVPAAPQLQGSVHWGAVVDLSGVQTPDVSPTEAARLTVIQLAPPAIPPRTTFPLVPPPRPPKLTSPSIVQGVSSLLKDLENISDGDIGQVTPSRPDIRPASRRLASTQHVEPLVA